MEIFDITCERVRRQKDNMIDLLFKPSNPEIYDYVAHGELIPIEGTVEESIEAYKPYARQEMFSVIEEMFPGVYQLPT